jgi:hypothetical protein
MWGSAMIGDDDKRCEIVGCFDPWVTVAARARVDAVGLAVEPDRMFGDRVMVCAQHGAWCGPAIAVGSEQRKAETMSDKKTICLDFDGVIHKYTSPWAGTRTIPDPPVPGAFKFIRAAQEAGWTVAILSTRSGEAGGIGAMRNWLAKHGLEPSEISAIDFPTTKPRAKIYIDDRGYYFRGRFPSIKWVEGFQPWHRTTKAAAGSNLEKAMAGASADLARASAEIDRALWVGDRGKLLAMSQALEETVATVRRAAGLEVSE